MFKLNEHIKTTVPIQKEEMPERVRETYDYMVRVCNSLNACRGLLSRRPSRNDQMIASILEKAQEAIMTLLEETGRMDEYEQWENSRSQQASE